MSSVLSEFLNHHCQAPETTQASWQVSLACVLIYEISRCVYLSRQLSEFWYGRWPLWRILYLIFSSRFYRGLPINYSFTVISVIAEMCCKSWKLVGLIILMFTLVDARYAFEVYTPSNITITDCFIQEVMDISHVQCGMHAWRKNIIALVYVDSTKMCHLCLSPREAGNQSRRTLPEGQTVVTAGRPYYYVLTVNSFLGMCMWLQCVNFMHNFGIDSFRI